MQKSIKAVKDPIVDLKKKLNREKLEKRNLLQAHEDEDNQLQYHFHKYNENKHSPNRNGYLAQKKLSRLKTRIRKLSDKFKDTYGITVVTDHLQCAETSDPIIKFANYNRRPIKNFT